MKKIGKKDDIFQFFKEAIKSNKHKDYVITDDLEVLELAYKFKLEITYLLITYDVEYQDKTQKLLLELQSVAKETFEIPFQTYQQLQLKDNHAGILAAIRLPLWQLEDLKDFIVVLDHLEIPGNIGTIYRTLDACGASGVILVNPITKQHNVKLTSAARGTNLIIPTVSLTYPEALQFLLDQNYTIYLGEPNLGLDYQNYEYRGKIAIVVGNERFGIEPDWYNHAHKKVFIPMKGNNNSLNVSIAASILVYEAAMKRHFHKN